MLDFFVLELEIPTDSFEAVGELVLDALVEGLPVVLVLVYLLPELGEDCVVLGLERVDDNLGVLHDVVVVGLDLLHTQDVVFASPLAEVHRIGAVFREPCLDCNEVRLKIKYLILHLGDGLLMCIEVEGEVVVTSAHRSQLLYDLLLDVPDLLE